MYAYRIKKFIGSYAAILNGLDAIVFTAGVGENDALTRKLTATNLQFLGIELDEDPSYVDKVLKEGAEKAQQQASELMLKVRAAVGL